MDGKVYAMIAVELEKLYLQSPKTPRWFVDVLLFFVVLPAETIIPGNNRFSESRLKIINLCLCYCYIIYTWK